MLARPLVILAEADVFPLVPLANEVDALAVAVCHAQHPQIRNAQVRGYQPA